ncbi:aldehyde ferredoxin oxidoreductase N-terminal domain-containing protein [Tissierella praeacuta]|uniref:aldehyde ferredoxin oxidoreductase N-terminal domain-containing protein n=1 Tax=Tissierella praeacuta TaxID=43131 RepID=UPI0033409397
MGKIIYINLTNRQIVEKENNFSDYGRGLIATIIDKEVPPDTDRLDDKNAVVLVPGLFSGTLAPSTGRLLIGTKKSKDEGIQISNLAGTISQKLSSFNIDAIVILGRNTENIPLTTVIEENNITLNTIDSIKGMDISPTIDIIHKLYGKHCGIIGIGPAGENLLPISTLFSTYPEGNPSFYCARNSIGDIFGHKGIKALVVNSKSHFNANVWDKENMKQASKALSRIIIEHPICGKALPGLGSITLMKMLKQGKNIDISQVDFKRHNKDIEFKINRTCSPLCVVGCLNRHAKAEEDYYSAPTESEALAALNESFGINNKHYAKDFTKRCFELGIDCIEFIFSCNIYFSLQGIKGNIEEMDKALEEVRNMTLTGRVLGSKTTGIYNLFREKEEYKTMVTKPSITEEDNFNINIQSKSVNIPGLSDLDYLYAYIIALENLGFCLFASFAFIDNDEALSLLSNMYLYKTGVKTSEKEILQYAIQTIKNEKEYERKVKLNNVSKTIPEFVKVLYRYFHKN